MKDLADRVAVVTGAASGIGLALARKFAEQKMRVVLADIEEEPLKAAEEQIAGLGAEVLAVRTDVMKEEEVIGLADASFSRFGNVHVLCNNAGVGGTYAGPIWEAPLGEFDWVFGVNFMGVLYGIRAFLPRMLSNNDEGHIVNTASMAGFLPTATPYAISKHAVVCLSEGLFQMAKARQSKISVSVLCPGMVHTNIIDSHRNRPPELGPRQTPPPMIQAQIDKMKETFAKGLQPDEVAGEVLQAILDDRFYIMPSQPFLLEALKARLTNIIEGKNPTPAKLS